MATKVVPYKPTVMKPEGKTKASSKAAPKSVEENVQPVEEQPGAAEAMPKQEHVDGPTAEQLAEWKKNHEAIQRLNKREIIVTGGFDFRSIWFGFKKLPLAAQIGIPAAIIVPIVGLIWFFFLRP